VSWIVVAIMAGWPGATVFRHLPVAVMIAAFAALPWMLWLENGNALLVASNRLRVLNLAQVAGGSANLLLTFLLVAVFHLGVIGALVAILAAQLITCAIGLTSIRQLLPTMSFDPPIAAKLLSGGARLHLNAVGAFLVAQSGVLILNHFRTSAETAYYQLALQLVAAIQVLPAAVSTVAYGIVSREGADAGWSDHRRLLIQALAAVSVVVAVAYAAAPVAVRLLAGRDFLPSVDVFRILLLGVIGMTMSTVMASQWIGRGFFLRVALMSGVSGLAVLGANWLVIPRYGMQGAAWVMVGVYTISIIVNGIMILWGERRWRRLKSPTERDAYVRERGVAL
jgi:O-antigen/teichoic acid export membrane protein